MKSTDIIVGRQYAYSPVAQKWYQTFKRMALYGPETVARVQVTDVGVPRWSESKCEYRRDGIAVMFLDYVKPGDPHTYKEDVVPANRIKERWIGDIKDTFEVEVTRQQNIIENARSRYDARRSEEKLRESAFALFTEIKDHALDILEANGFVEDAHFEVYDTNYDKCLKLTPDGLQHLVELLEV